MKTTATTFAKSTTCPICNCIVMVRMAGKVPVRTCRALALANHTRTIHTSLLPSR